MTAKQRIRIAAQYNGEEPHEIWHPDYLEGWNSPASLEAAAQVALDGLYDFAFQAETSAIPVSDGRVAEPLVVGRVDNVTAQSYLAARFPRLGLVSTINTTNNNPYDVARRLATLDLVTGGRAGWNLVLGGNPQAWRNYRDIGPREGIDRYAFGEEFLGIVRDYLSGAADEEFTSVDGYFSVRASRFGSPRGEGGPFVILSGDSPRSRDLGAAYADGVYTHYANEGHGIAFREDLRRRARKAGRDPDELRIFARAALLVAESDADAEALQREILPYQIPRLQLQRWLEAIWNTPLPDLDPDGPLPAHDPPPGSVARLGLSIGLYLDGPAQDAVDRLRRIQAETGFGARGVLIAASGTDLVIGGPSTVAERLERLVDSGAVDGLVIAPHISGGWLSDFNRLVIPILQERGRYATEFHDETLRERVQRR